MHCVRRSFLQYEKFRLKHPLHYPLHYFPGLTFFKICEPGKVFVMVDTISPCPEIFLKRALLTIFNFKINYYLILDCMVLTKLRRNINAGGRGDWGDFVRKTKLIYNSINKGCRCSLSNDSIH